MKEKVTVRTSFGRFLWRVLRCNFNLLFGFVRYYAGVYCVFRIKCGYEGNSLKLKEKRLILEETVLNGLRNGS